MYKIELPSFLDFGVNKLEKDGLKKVINKIPIILKETLDL
jgi:hypothetical protein